MKPHQKNRQYCTVKGCLRVNWMLQTTSQTWEKPALSAALGPRLWQSQRLTQATVQLMWCWSGAWQVLALLPPPNLGKVMVTVILRGAVTYPVQVPHAALFLIIFLQGVIAVELSGTQEHTKAKHLLQNGADDSLVSTLTQCNGRIPTGSDFTGVRVLP